MKGILSRLILMYHSYIYLKKLFTFLKLQFYYAYKHLSYINLKKSSEEKLNAGAGERKKHNRMYTWTFLLFLQFFRF